MDFENIDIHKFLKASMFDRFHSVTPFDFEDFMAHFFLKMGFEVQQTNYTGDFGADLIISKHSDEKTVVQIKRYQASAPVGAQDINQVLGAKSFYKTNHALVVTTSKYTKSAIKLAKETDVELWAWDDLTDEISNLWLEGEDHFEFFKENFSEQNETDGTKDVQLQIIPKDFDVSDTGRYHFIRFNIKNNSAQNVECQLELPTVLTFDKRQVQTNQWTDDYFSAGIIYAGATISCQCLVLSEQLSNLEKGDRLIIRAFLPTTNKFIILDQPLVDSPGSCFIVTHCFGKYSNEYLQMIYFRDHALRRNWMGRYVISWYYNQSNSWKKFVDRRPRYLFFVVRCIKLCIKIFLKIFGRHIPQ